MTEQEVRCKSAEFRVREAKIEADAAAIREKIGSLQCSLNGLDLTRAQLRVEEAEIFKSFTDAVQNG